MRQFNIRLADVTKVKELVDEANKCEFDVDIFYNHVLIDGKSLMGVLGLDLSKVLTVQCHGYNKNFEQYLLRNLMLNKDRMRSDKISRVCARVSE